MSEETNPLLTTAEVAERFNVAQSTVSRWVSKGQIAAIRTPGGGLRFRLSDIEAALRGEQVA